MRLHFVPTGVWDLHRISDAICKPVITDFLVLKHAELFVGQPVAWNSIAIENARVRGEAGKNCRSRVVFSPIKNFGQRRPIWFVAQIGLPRFGASHDRAIKPAVQEVLNAKIEIAQMLLTRIASRKLWQRVKFKGNRSVDQRQH